MASIGWVQTDDSPVLQRVVVLAVVGRGAWDASGLLAGVGSGDPVYDLLESAPAGGVRTWGVVLGVLTVFALVAAYRSSRVGCWRRTRLCLALLAAWYVAWAAGITSAWIIHGRVMSGDAILPVLAVAVISVIGAVAQPRGVGGCGDCCRTPSSPI